MLCAFCNLGSIDPEAVAGLCVSCRYEVSWRHFYPVWDGPELYLKRARAEPGNPFGWNESSEPPAYLYDPSALYESPTPADVAASRAELFKLFAGPVQFAREKAKAASILIRQLKELGVRLGIDAATGFVVMDEPLKVPYPMLAEFVRLQLFVSDELTKREIVHHEQNRIKTAIARRARKLENRNSRLDPEECEPGAEQTLDGWREGDDGNNGFAQGVLNGSASPDPDRSDEGAAPR